MPIRLKYLLIDSPKSDRVDGARAFIAIDIPKQVRNGLAEAAKLIDCKPAKPVREDQIHITVLFLGSIGKAQLSSATKALSETEAKEFNISFNGIGTFSRTRPNVIFAKVDDGISDLERISSGMQKSLSNEIRFESRDFHAHATLARVRNPTEKDVEYVNGFVAIHSEDSLGEFTCKEIKIKTSVLNQEGPEYTDVFTKKLTP